MNPLTIAGTLREIIKYLSRKDTNRLRELSRWHYNQIEIVYPPLERFIYYLCTYIPETLRVFINVADVNYNINDPDDKRSFVELAEDTRLREGARIVMNKLINREPFEAMDKIVKACDDDHYFPYEIVRHGPLFLADFFADIIGRYCYSYILDHAAKSRTDYVVEWVTSKFHGVANPHEYFCVCSRGWRCEWNNGRAHRYTDAYAYHEIVRALLIIHGNRALYNHPNSAVWHGTVDTLRIMYTDDEIYKLDVHQLAIAVCRVFRIASRVGYDKIRHHRWFGHDGGIYTVDTTDHPLTEAVGVVKWLIVDYGLRLTEEVFTAAARKYGPPALQLLMQSGCEVDPDTALVSAAWCNNVSAMNFIRAEFPDCHLNALDYMDITPNRTLAKWIARNKKG